MKPVQEFYKEIMASEELKKGFVEAAKAGKQMEFIKEHGCEASAEEIEAFMKGQITEERALSEDELENVAGGGCNDRTTVEAILSVVGMAVGCVTAAIDRALSGPTGQKKEGEGRICNK